MNEYYVYQLRVEGEELPFYIGKGRGNRSKSHLTENAYDNNLHKKNKIKKALREDKQILVEHIEENLDEAQSYAREIYWIAFFGRKDLKKGPLTNMTDGGEGRVNFLFSKESLQRLKEAATGPNNYWWGKAGSRTGMKAPPETRAKMSASQSGEKNPFYGKSHSVAAREAMSMAKKGGPQVGDGFAGRTHSEESKARIGDSGAKVLYEITKPDGTIEVIRNMRQYCRDNNLTAPRMIDVANGGSNHHKGHKVRRIAE